MMRTVKPRGDKNIFLSFVKEYWPGQKEGTIIGRIEVTHPTDEHYPSEELRISCDDIAEYREFEMKHDFKYVSKKTLDEIKRSPFLLRE